MLIFSLRRLNLFIFTMFLLSLLSFSLSFLFPGDQLINISGQINATPEQLALLAELYQSQNNIFHQYLAYIDKLFHGDLGLSMASQQPISTEIVSFLPATIELSIVALLLAMTVGIPIGFIAAIYHRKMADNVILSISMIGYSIPVFWLGLLAILIFSIQLGWFPSAGQISLLYEIEHVTGIQFFDILISSSPYKWQAFRDASAHIFLPAVYLEPP